MQQSDQGLPHMFSEPGLNVEEGEKAQRSRKRVDVFIADLKSLCSTTYISQWPAVLFSLLIQLPSFLVPTPLKRRHADRGEQRATHPLAHLNGIRGIAACMVFARHVSFQAFNLGPTFGVPEDSGKPRSLAVTIMSLPVIRIFFLGRGALAIFFLLSGYVLSVKPIQLIRAQRSDSQQKLMTTLSSYVFKRGFRLFLPCLVSTFISMLCVYAGFWESARTYNSDKSLGGEVMIYPAQYSTIWKQGRDWSIQFWEFVYVWQAKHVLNTFHYDLALWTIPLEFRNSLFLFMCITAFAKLRPSVRMSCFFLLILRTIDWCRWDMACYWSGCILAEVSAIKTEKDAQEDASAEKRKPMTLQWKCFWTFNFICGLWLMSYPDQGANRVPGFRHMSKFVPNSYKGLEESRHFTQVGVTQLVWSTNNAPFLQSMFHGKVLQYLGLISFSLYLMHWPMITGFTFNILPYIWRYTGDDPATASYVIGWLFAATVTAFLLVWAADVFWRAVDTPIGKFVRWLEARCLNPAYA